MNYLQLLLLQMLLHCLSCLGLCAQTDLKETRATRDGYLADRNQLLGVLTIVRRMRNKLLEAHQDSERRLSADAKTLQSVIENAIVDIEELHAEIGTLATLCSCIVLSCPPVAVYLCAARVVLLWGVTV
jgi:hypothetical protein